MRRILLSVIALALTLAPVNLTATANTQNDLIVASEILSLREGPGLSYPIKATLKNGDSLTKLDQQGDWLHVDANGQKGWVAAWLTKSTQTTSADAGKIVISQVNQLNLRAEPTLSASVLAQLSAGSEAQFIKQQGDWVLVQFGQKQGWVFANYVTINQPTAASTAPSKQVTNQSNTFTVSVDAVNVRKAPDLTSKKLGLATKGTQFKVTDRNDNWVQIDYNGKSAWIYSFYGTFSAQQVATNEPAKQALGQVTIIYNGTNLREQASTNSSTVARAQAGETYSIIEQQGDWYKISLGNNQAAYVAGWVVSTDQQKKSTPKAERKKGTLKGVTIVLDPGHGGNDHGTTGVRGTAEKDVTTKTAELLKSKLRSAGATVILTRESDEYVDLRKRVSIGHQYHADAFISLHYDATSNSSVNGITTYYLNGYQKELADYVHAGLKRNVSLRDRGVQQGNYLVLRENRQPAILMELGYLSNASEERLITQDMYREQATLGIYQGLLKYFDAQLD